MAKLLIAYDGTESSKNALNRALSLRKADDQLGIVSITPVTAGGGRSAGPIDPVDNVEHHRELVHEGHDVLADAGVEAVSHVAVGDPATAICAVALDEGYDMIVIGSRNLGVVKRAVLGSVSDAVAHRAHCDVLIVK